MAGANYSQSKGTTEIVPGFQGVLNAFRSLLPQTRQQFGEAFSAPQLPLEGILGPLMSTLGPAAGLFNQGAQGGFVPQMLAGLEGQLLPAMERAFGRGKSAIEQQAASRGTLWDTGTTQQVADYRGGLEAGLGQQLGAAGTALAQGGQQVMGNLAQGGLGAMLGLIDQALQQSRFGATQPLSALGTVAGAINSVPTGGRQSSKGAGAQVGGKGGGGVVKG